MIKKLLSVIIQNYVICSFWNSGFCRFFSLVDQDSGLP